MKSSRAIEGGQVADRSDRRELFLKAATQWQSASDHDERAVLTVRNHGSQSSDSAQAHEHPNATAYRMAADAFRAGDLAAVESVVDPDVIWHVPGQYRWARDYRGRGDLLLFLARLPTVGFRLREHDVFGNDVHVCSISEMGARRPGLEVSTRVVSIFRFRDGRQVERWLYPDDMTARDAIFS